MALGIVEHFEQHAELDTVGVRLDFTRLRRQLLNRPGIFFGLSLRGVVDELDVRIGNGDLLEILVHRGPPFLVASLDFEGHLGAAMVLPIDLFSLENPRLVFLGVDLDFEVVSGCPRAGARGNLYRFAGCELRIHAGRRYADALLSAAHAQPMEFGPVEKLGEYRRNLLADNAGAVVDHRYPKAVRLARGRWRLAVRSHFELDHDFRQNACFLAGVKRIIYGFFDAGEQGFSRIVEAQQVTVLGKEFGNRDLALTGPHLGRGYSCLRFRGLGLGWSRRWTLA